MTEIDKIERYLRERLRIAENYEKARLALGVPIARKDINAWQIMTAMERLEVVKSFGGRIRFSRPIRQMELLQVLTVISKACERVRYEDIWEQHKEEYAQILFAESCKHPLPKDI